MNIILYMYTHARARARACVCVCVYVHPCTQSCFSKIKQICDCLRCWQLAIYLSSIICFRRIHRQYSNIQATMHIYIYIYVCVCICIVYIIYCQQFNGKRAASNLPRQRDSIVWFYRYYSNSTNFDDEGFKVIDKLLSKVHIVKAST